MAKREPVPQGLRTKLLVRSGGHCEDCGKNLKKLTPHIHHIDFDSDNNDISNLEVLCPNCHSERHSEDIEEEDDRDDTPPIVDALGFGSRKGRKGKSDEDRVRELF